MVTSSGFVHRTDVIAQRGFHDWNGALGMSRLLHRDGALSMSRLQLGQRINRREKPGNKVHQGIPSTEPTSEDVQPSTFSNPQTLRRESARLPPKPVRMSPKEVKEKQGDITGTTRKHIREQTVLLKEGASSKRQSMIGRIHPVQQRPCSRRRRVLH